jgi:hypothetical protein
LHDSRPDGFRPFDPQSQGATPAKRNIKRHLCNSAPSDKHKFSGHMPPRLPVNRRGAIGAAPAPGVEGWTRPQTAPAANEIRVAPGVPAAAPTRLV